VSCSFPTIFRPPGFGAVVPRDTVPWILHKPYTCTPGIRKLLSSRSAGFLLSNPSHTPSPFPQSPIPSTPLTKTPTNPLIRSAWALGLCVCVCLGCIPFLMNSLKDVVHHCSHCGCRLATWHRSGAVEVHAHA